MSTPLIPQEVFLLERYSSLEYFGQLRDSFVAMVQAAEEALREFMRHLPPDYRSRPTFQQPDVTWGETVLPNMRWTIAGLNEGYILLSHADWTALGQAGNVSSAIAALQRDFSSEWMPQPFEQQFDQAWLQCAHPSSNINLTSLAQWRPGSLTSSYTEANRGPLAPPTSWPRYRANAAVRVRTGAKVPRNGIYLPDVSGACAQVLIQGQDAWGAPVLKNPTNSADRSFDRAPTTWTLVERIADSGGGVPRAQDPVDAGVRLRCIAGEGCPKSGWWSTPSRATERQRFESGTPLPDFGGDYGTTIWQWDDDQTS